MMFSDLRSFIRVRPLEEKFKKWFAVGYDLVHLSDASQQIHLGMKGYEYLPMSDY